MILWNKTQAELTAALETAQGAKRREILKELQKRWEEQTKRLVRCEDHSIYTIPRFDFELCYR